MEWLTQNWIWLVALIAIVGWMQLRRFGHHSMAATGGHDHGVAHAGSAAPPGAALDPVSGNPVRTDRALSAVHGRHVFYFESTDTRRRFEAEPDKYAAQATAQAQTEPRHRHRGGCC